MLWGVLLAGVAVAQATFTLDLVITVYDESLDWLNDLEARLPATIIVAHCYIYSKVPHPELPFVRFPIEVQVTRNVGREGLGHLLFLASTHLVSDLVLFCQGGPHLTDLTVIEYTLAHYPFQFVPSTAMFMSLADQSIRCIGRHNGQAHGYLFKPHLDDLLPATCHAFNLTLQELCWMYFGEFIVNRAALYGFRDLYRARVKSILLPALQMSNDPPMGHVLERLWLALFTASGSTAVESPTWISRSWFRIQKFLHR